MVSATKKQPRFNLSAWKLPAGRLLWLLTVLLALTIFTVTLPLRYNQLLFVAAENQPYLEQLGLSNNFLIVYLMVFDALDMFAFALIAAIIVWRRTTDWLALLVSATLVLIGVILTRPVDSLTQINSFWHIPLSTTLAMGVMAVILFMFLFPDGRFVPSWSKWVALGWAVWVFGWYLVPQFFVRPSPWPPQLQPGPAVAGWIICGLAIQIYRYRRVSNATQRQQTRWVVLGFVASAIGFMSFIYFAPLVPDIREPGLGHLIYILIGVPFLYLSLLMLPLALGISISRYRLWDIEVIINRTLVYGVLTLMLTGIYLILVLTIQQIFREFTGQNSPLAVAISTLATAGLFYPLRQKTQSFIDRRFFPRRHMAAKVLATIPARLRDELDLTRLTDNLEDIIGTVLQPASVLTWLPTGSGFRVYIFDATQTTEDINNWIDGEVQTHDPLIAYMRQVVDDAVPLEYLNLDSPSLARFIHSSVSVLMLLRSRGDLIGWLSLGPRLSEQGYSIDDFRFLSQVAEHAGPAVKAALLAQDNQSAALERQRMEQQLSVARLVQHRLLPPHEPDIPGWEICAHYRPAQAVGGDFYDFLQYPDGRVGVIIGDVSDKGIPAALLMASGRSILRSVAYQHITPGVVLQRANQLLLPDMPEGLFITCLYAVLDPLSGRLSVANAGHNLPIHCKEDCVTEVWARGMPLGWMMEAEYEEVEATLAEGDKLLLYSDGLTEARNRLGEMYSTERLINFLRQSPAGGAELINSIMDTVLAFTGPRGTDDDVAIVSLQHHSNATSLE